MLTNEKSKILSIFKGRKQQEVVNYSYFDVKYSTLLVMHIGRNISKLRDLKGLKQEEFAKLLNISQQAVSRLENKKDIDDDLLQQIADKLDLTVDVIKQFSPDATINSINQQGGNVYVERLYINPVEKIEELYQKLLKEKEDTIHFLKEEIKQLRKR